MTETASEAAAPISEDRPCLHCGYNLRGLLLAGLCPECGTAIGLSLPADLLDHADPAWLDRLRQGTSLRQWAVLIGILGGFVGGMLTAFLPIPLGAIAMFGLVGMALRLWALFLITSQDPQMSLQEDPVTLGKVIRSLVVLYFVCNVVVQAQLTLLPDLLMQIIGVLMLFVEIVLTFGELYYFRRFARRIPDPKLAKSTARLMWLYPVTQSILVVVSIGFWTTSPTTGGGANPPAPPVMFFVFMTVGGLLSLVCLLWYVRLLTRYKAVFRKAATAARQRVIATQEALESSA